MSSHSSSQQQQLSDHAAACSQQSRVPDTVEVNAVLVEHNVAADICGAVGCTTTSSLARVRNVKSTPRVLCESCRTDLLRKSNKCR